MIKRFNLSLKLYLLFGLFIGILIPILIAGTYTINGSKNKLYHQFAKYRDITTSNIASAMIKPINTFSPNMGSLALEIIKQDNRIIKIDIYDKLSEMEFIKFYVPQREKGKIFKNRKDILKGSAVIGWVEVSFSDSQLQTELYDKQNFLIKIFTFTFLALLLIMYPMLYKKVLLPLKKLLKQTNDFKNNNLEKEYLWDKNDEISEVGKSFNNARISILKLVTKLTSKNEELERLYVTDRLTGLYNRHKLDQVLEYEKNRDNRYKHNFGIILLDIDHFKNVNDKYGHQVGDIVLVEMAKILQKTIRKTDTLGRWGGEEFLIIVPETSLLELEYFAQKLRETIASYNFSTIGKLTSSFGISVFKENTNIKELISQADNALYKAKKEGRNKVCS